MLLLSTPRWKCSYFYHPHTKLWEVNVFTPVYESGDRCLPLGPGDVCLWLEGVVCLWVCGVSASGFRGCTPSPPGRHTHQTDTPSRQTLQQADPPPGRHLTTKQRSPLPRRHPLSRQGMATDAGSMHPTGMHSCPMVNFTIKLWADIISWSKGIL